MDRLNALLSRLGNQQLTLNEQLVLVTAIRKEIADQNEPPIKEILQSPMLAHL
jgi:hypothetical protein